MAVTRVNTSSGTVGGGSATTVATNAASLTAGNLFVLGVRWTTGAGAVSSIADTAGNDANYILIKRFDGGTTSLALYAVFDCLGNGSNVVTVTFTAGVTNRAAIGVQYSGALAYPLVGSGWAATTSGGSIATQSAMHGTDYLAVLLAQNDGSAGTWTAGTGFGNAVQDSGNVTIFADAIATSNTNLAPAMSSNLTNGKILIAASFHNSEIGGGSPSPGEGGGGVSRSRIQRHM